MSQTLAAAYCYTYPHTENAFDAVNGWMCRMIPATVEVPLEQQLFDNLTSQDQGISLH